MNGIRTLQPSSAYRYQQVTPDSAIDKAWLDARESSEIEPEIIDKLNKLGQTHENE